MLSCNIQSIFQTNHLCLSWQTFDFLSLAGKIKDLFPKGTLSSSTTLVLVNAIYFKGRWLQEFKKENTSKEKFWLNKVLSISYVQ